MQDIVLWFSWGSSASHCNVTTFTSYHNRFIYYLNGEKKKKNSAPQSYCKRCWNQILCFVFPAPHTFQSRILSIPLPVCPLSRNKIQRMPGVFCTFLIWLLVQGHVSAKHVSICLSLAAFKMSAVFWETEASEAMWKQYILSINNISCFIWLVMGHAFFFFLIFKATAFIYHHPGTYLGSQWTENTAWICWKNNLARVVLLNITRWSKHRVSFISPIQNRY